MLGNVFLVLTFFVCLVYAVVPYSLWRKHSTLIWRGAILITCTIGYGIIGLGLIMEMIELRQVDEFSVVLPGFSSLRLSLMVGIIFLPLAAVGSLHSLYAAIRAKDRPRPA